MLISDLHEIPSTEDFNRGNYYYEDWFHGRYQLTKVVAAASVSAA
jgi:hypothetical protein